MKKLEIFQFLIDHFNGRSNDFQETITFFEVNDDNVIIHTQFVLDMEIKDDLEALMLNGPGDMPRNLIKEKLNEESFMDNLEFNYVSGFYLEHIEGLDIDSYLDNSEFEFECNRYLTVRFTMDYHMERSEIERMMVGYKNCA